jgi:hypothetical protein
LELIDIISQCIDNGTGENPGSLEDRLGRETLVAISPLE